MKKRASKSQKKEPNLRRGHFSNEFNDIEGYEVGNTSWLNIDQAPNRKSNAVSLENAYINGLQWFKQDSITSKNNVETTISGDKIDIDVELEGENEEDSTLFNAFINTVN